ncbi:MAG: glycosyltransferase family 2 protein [Oligoflexia bacterium]|nr:glycosyltransferase family 2 protein [Oligoflexia bacterium]
MKIIVIAPCYNEEVKIGKVVSRIQNMPEKIVNEILVVDDGSTDQSVKVVKDLGASILSVGSVKGVGFALREGFKYAQQKGYDIIVVIAGNNKDEPNEIPDLIKGITEKGCDFVQGSRFLKKIDFGHMPFYRKIATRLHPFLFSIFTGRRLTESTNGFRAFKTSLLNDPKIKLDQPWLDQYELEPYLYYKTITLGYKTMEIPCTKTYPPKKVGYTKMKPISGWWSILRPLLLLRLGLRS